MFFLEGVAVFRTKVHDRFHVDFVESRQKSSRVLSWTKRVAMVLRIMLIGFTSSIRLAAPETDIEVDAGCLLWGTSKTGTDFGCTGVGLASDAFDSTTLETSSLRIRPPGPVAGDLVCGKLVIRPSAELQPHDSSVLGIASRGFRRGRGGWRRGRFLGGCCSLFGRLDMANDVSNDSKLFCWNDNLAQNPETERELEPRLSRFRCRKSVPDST